MSTLLRQSQARVDQTEGRDLAILSSHMAVSAASDALLILQNSISVNVAVEDHFEQLSTIAKRIGDAGRAAFAAGDAEGVATKQLSQAATASCSFCGRNEEERARLVRGPGVAICDECVERAGVLLGHDATGGGAA